MSGKFQKMYRHRLFKWVVMLLCATVVSLPLPVMAELDRVTRGDVQALLEALPSGGMVVLYQASDMAALVAAPAEGTRGEIRPLPDWDGKHYCVDDWHVLLLGWFAGGDKTFSRQDAADALSSISMSFTLERDGESEVLDTVRTPIKRFLASEMFGWDEAYAFQEGRVMSPDELGVGEYTLTVVSDINGWILPFSSQFFIDPSESATCTE